MLAKLMEGRKYDFFLVDSIPSFRFVSSFPFSWNEEIDVFSF